MAALEMMCSSADKTAATYAQVPMWLLLLLLLLFLQLLLLLLLPDDGDDDYYICTLSTTCNINTIMLLILSCC